MLCYGDLPIITKANRRVFIWKGANCFTSLCSLYQSKWQETSKKLKTLVAYAYRKLKNTTKRFMFLKNRYRGFNFLSLYLQTKLMLLKKWYKVFFSAKTNRLHEPIYVHPFYVLNQKTGHNIVNQKAIQYIRHPFIDVIHMYAWKKTNYTYDPENARIPAVMRPPNWKTCEATN